MKYACVKTLEIKQCVPFEIMKVIIKFFHAFQPSYRITIKRRERKVILQINVSKIRDDWYNF